MIANQFGGTLTIDQVAARLKDELHLNVTVEGLSNFVDKLGAKHLLETNEQETSQTGQPALLPLARTSPYYSFSRENKKRSRLGRLLFWKIAYFDPDTLFNRLLPHTRFLFTSTFLFLVIVTILAAACVTAFNWTEITDQVRTLYSTTSVLWALVIMMPILILHEMAHGLACKYFGGEVHEMGFLLLYFQPACFCNVSDSYVFAKKSQRLWVMTAGVYIQTFLWALLTLLWRILTPESLIAQFIFINVAITGFVTILQFNPLIKLDGYYILSELFSIPNLRSKSFAWLRAKSKSIITGTSGAIGGLSRRERRIYWLYGMIAFIYSFSLIKYFVLRFEQFFVEQYQGTGFILFWGVALFVVSDPLVQTIEHILPRKMTEKKQSVSRYRNLFVTGFFCLCGFLVLTLGRWELKVASECSLIPFERADVRAEVPGTIEQIYFDEGQTVHKGDVIARLADYKYSGEKAKTSADISEAQARLQLMVAGPSKEEIALAQSQVDRAEASIKKAEAQAPIARERLDYANKNYERVKRLFDEKLLASMSFDEAQRDLNIRKREFDEVQHDVEEKRRLYQEARKALAKVMAGTRAEEIEAKRAQIEGLVSQRTLLDTESTYTAIRSPIDGIITTHFLKQQEKAYLEQGDVICQVANTQKVLTEIPVPEKEVGDVKIGFYVRLKANAYPSKEFDGKVTQISDIADPQDKNGRILMVRSEINNPDLLLKPEMTGYAKIYCGKRTIGELVSRRLVRFIRTEFWSWF
ncbi:MAG: efflux RND transporter periplasmic adaptor subunit [Acidobacteriia bacterium]|nr:efflux RND transporter periplasmic adaptor subunit [Terriglobia bacterium]